ncbi:hypothetical protein KP509_1Z083200 [Ceratopteris richardii]|nr:hypothetical protein KP509_1Z083200 [Ceratopteris richardii]KAH6557979.1 hypothetical protein KP509_1Z083200 [Ceratopteris richardii]KAH6557983.1 hypothetical protein KP509_1Z083200 [Ceratopteris richardii]
MYFRRNNSNDEQLQLHLNIISAQNLKSSIFRKKMQAYCIVWIDPQNRLATHVDVSGGVHPTWNTTMTFSLNKHHTTQKSLISIEIFSKGHLKDTLLGTVGVLVSNLISEDMCREGTRFCALQIRRPSGRSHGILNIGSMIIHPTSVKIGRFPNDASSVLIPNTIVEDEVHEDRGDQVQQCTTQEPSLGGATADSGTSPLLMKHDNQDQEVQIQDSDESVRKDLTGTDLLLVHENQGHKDEQHNDETQNFHEAIAQVYSPLKEKNNDGKISVIRVQDGDPAIPPSCYRDLLSDHCMIETIIETLDQENLNFHKIFEECKIQPLNTNKDTIKNRNLQIQDLIQGGVQTIGECCGTGFKFQKPTEMFADVSISESPDTEEVGTTQQVTEEVDPLFMSQSVSVDAHIEVREAGKASLTPRGSRHETFDSFEVLIRDESRSPDVIIRNGAPSPNQQIIDTQTYREIDEDAIQQLYMDEGYNQSCKYADAEVIPSTNIKISNIRSDEEIVEDGTLWTACDIQNQLQSSIFLTSPDSERCNSRTICKLNTEDATPLTAFREQTNPDEIPSQNMQIIDAQSYREIDEHTTQQEYEEHENSQRCNCTDTDVIRSPTMGILDIQKNQELVEDAFSWTACYVQSHVHSTTSLSSPDLLSCNSGTYKGTLEDATSSTACSAETRKNMQTINPQTHRDIDGDSIQQQDVDYENNRKCKNAVTHVIPSQNIEILNIKGDQEIVEDAISWTACGVKSKARSARSFLSSDLETYNGQSCKSSAEDSTSSWTVCSGQTKQDEMSSKMQTADAQTHIDNAEDRIQQNHVDNENNQIYKSTVTDLFPSASFETLSIQRDQEIVEDVTSWTTCGGQREAYSIISPLSPTFKTCNVQTCKGFIEDATSAAASGGQSGKDEKPSPNMQIIDAQSLREIDKDAIQLECIDNENNQVCESAITGLTQSISIVILNIQRGKEIAEGENSSTACVQSKLHSNISLPSSHLKKCNNRNINGTD